MRPSGRHTWAALMLGLGCGIPLCRPALGQTSTSDSGPGSGAAASDGATPSSSPLDSAVGGHWLFAAGKAMPGLTLRAGKGLWWGAFETSLVWLTEADPEGRFELLGNQLGGFVMVRRSR
jgi:hypothetical protein